MAAEKTPVDWVKPQIDTKKPRFFYFSSACRPFGLVNLSPDTKTDAIWDSGYRYYDKKIECFSHIHGWQIAGLPVMPVAASSDHKNYASTFSHDGEIVKAGYHKVVLKDHGVTAELTSTTRVGFHRYTYQKDEAAHIIIDLGRKLMDHKMINPVAQLRDDKMAIEGSTTMGSSGRRKKEFTVYYVAEFSQPCKAIGDWEKGKVTADFGMLTKPLLMKVGLSYTSLEGARKNLTTELPHWDFDQVVQESYDHWNDWLGRIQVEGGSDAQKTKFYTDLWHAHLGRRIISDVDHSYPDNTGAQTVVRQGKRPHHNFDALWGAQWSLNVLWPMAWPELMDDFADTMINIYHNGGMIPRGPSGGNYTFVMIGDPATSFFSAAYHKGIRNWDKEAAFAGLMRNAFPGGIRDHAGYETQTYSNGGGMAYYVNRGYVPLKIPKSEGGHREGAAQTLEYSYQDWCLAQLAKSLDRKEEAELLEKRANNYKNLWDPKIKWMRPKNMDGSWYEPFSPINNKGFTSRGFVESASAIYTFYIPHDLTGLAELFGSNGDEDQGQMGALSALMAIGLFDMTGGAAQKPAYDLTAPIFDKITIKLNPKREVEYVNSHLGNTTQNRR